MQSYIDVIAAHMDGKKIEVRNRSLQTNWIEAVDPLFNFMVFEYRIAPEPKIPDTIEWEHVAPQFTFMCRDKDETVWLSQGAPTRGRNLWGTHGESDAMGFASYKRGNLDWQDSLVERPQP